MSRAALRREAGARSFERGDSYFKSGKVSSLVEHEGTLAAKVQGTRSYRVKLFIERKRIRCDCNCPLGQGGVFCKHGVAAGLAWLQAKPGQAPGRKPARSSGATMEDVRAWLLSQDKSTLAGMLMEQAMDDDKLRRRLLLTVAKKSAHGPDLDTYRKAIDQAVNEEVEDYQDVYNYASGIGEGIDSIEELLKEGRATEALDLSEYALQALEGAMGSVDDSDGHLGGLLDRLQDIHFKACRKAKPDPVAMAGRLFEWELHGNWGAFHGAAKTYSALLGKKGLAEYRKRAEAEWAKVPPLKGGRRDADGYSRRYRITHLMETLAKESGDVEALVAIQKRDLSSPSAYLRIAEAYKENGNGDGALEWAEAGRKAFPKDADFRLLEFLADEYHRRKRHDEAMAIAWGYFAAHPSLEPYKTLKRHAGKADRWKEWRLKAVELLRQRIAKTKATHAGQWAGSPPEDRSELVRIFLWERDLEAAWGEANAGGCSPPLWLQLAEKREKAHPADTLSIYQRLIEPTLGPTNNEAYGRAVALLRKVQGLMGRLGKKKEFGRYLESVRAGNRQKRNFIKMLERGRWE